MPEDMGEKLKRMQQRRKERQERTESKGIGERMERGLRRAATPPSTPPSTPSLSEEERQALSERASSLGSQLSDLRSKASLSSLRDRLEDLDSVLSGLPASLEEVRQGGYVYKAYLENKTSVLREQWEGLRERIDREAAQQGRVLVQQADALQRRLSAMGTRLSAASLDAVERDIEALDGKVDDAHRTLEGTFDTLQNNARQTATQVETIGWMQQQIAGASFGLRPEENVVEAVEAQYLTEGEKEGPEGILYLTDQRLLFEQKEDIATKKFLFITTEKERVQQLLLQAPIGAVEKAGASERRAFLSKRELLELTFGAQASVSQALFRLKADSEEWQALIGRARSGDIAGERVGVEAAPAMEISTADIPTRCPTCGANLTTEIVRGMQSVSCEYCGTVIRF